MNLANNEKGTHEKQCVRKRRGSGALCEEDKVAARELKRLSSARKRMGL
jgi:hypothetical protein